MKRLRKLMFIKTLNKLQKKLNRYGFKVACKENATALLLVEEYKVATEKLKQEIKDTL